MLPKLVKSVKSGMIFFIGLLLSFTLFAKSPAELRQVALADLPAEVRTSLQLIRQGRPFPNAQDGAVFGNYEEILPRQKRGYYHEYTVPTPGAHHRGARRIVTGAETKSSNEFYYTDDHYANFRRIKE